MTDKKEVRPDGGPLHPTPVPGNPDEFEGGFSKVDEFAAQALRALIPMTVTVVEVKNNDDQTVSQLRFPTDSEKNDIAIEALQWGAAMMRAKGVVGL